MFFDETGESTISRKEFVFSCAIIVALIATWFYDKYIVKNAEEGK